jgi:hypothetical protein
MMNRATPGKELLRDCSSLTERIGLVCGKLKVRSIVTDIKDGRFVKKHLTCSQQMNDISFRGRPGLTCSSVCAEVSLTLPKTVGTSINRAAVLCGRAIYRRLVCDRPGPRYGGTVFISDDLAVDGSPCASAADGQGAILAPVHPRRQPHTLGSIYEHEYCGYACRSEHFLCRPCLSAQWTAPGNRWTHRQLCGATQCLHV